MHRRLYTAPAKKNYKKNQNQKLIQGIKWEENQKCNKKKSKSNKSQESEQWSVGRTVAGNAQFQNTAKFRRLQKFATLRNFAGGENSQPAKFCRLRKIATCEILQVAKFSQSCKIPLLSFFFYFLLLFPCIFCSSFFLVSDLQR